MVLFRGNEEWSCIPLYDFDSLMKQKDTQNLFVILITNDKYENFNYTVHR